MNRLSCIDLLGRILNAMVNKIEFNWPKLREDIPLIPGAKFFELPFKEILHVPPLIKIFEYSLL